jgi:ATP-binding cassette subfamily B protein
MSMGMGMGGGMGHAGRSMMRSMRHDPSVAATSLTPGVTRRILEFARPFRAQLIAFLVLVVIDAGLVVAPPLLVRRIINEGIGGHDRGIVVWTSVAIAGMAVAEAVLSLAQRYYSSRIGEGLIHLLRTKVFSHVQQMPIAFFTRTQTGALVSRLNSDVIGAQQAFTSTLSSVVSNVVTLVMVLTTMLLLSWQITVVALILLPLFVVPARILGRRHASNSREGLVL